MEELKLLVTMVANLPSMALWVIALFFAYKVVVVGSIYGVIRFVAEKLFAWLTQRKVVYKEIRPTLDGMCVGGTTEQLIAQLNRLKGKGLAVESNYLHSQTIDWLREAIDAKIKDDMARTMKKSA